VTPSTWTWKRDEWKEFTKLPYHYENQFDATTGNYKLTVVLSAGGDAFGKFESPLAIDPYDGTLQPQRSGADEFGASG